VPEGSSTAKGKDDPTIRNELKALLDDKYGPSLREYKPRHKIPAVSQILHQI
jgi:hypothetical protein